MNPRIFLVILMGLFVVCFGPGTLIGEAEAQSASTDKSAKAKKSTRQTKASAAAKTKQKKATVARNNKTSAKTTVQKKNIQKSVAQSNRKKAAIRKVSLRSAPPSAAEVDVMLDGNGLPMLQSSAFYVVNQRTGEVLLERKSREALPIASITKLMTAMVVLEANQGLKEVLTISEDDIDSLKGTRSRLVVGTQLTREDLMHLMLMSSENRAASALARHYPGGSESFVKAMNVKARLLGLWDTHFEDSSGLNPGNVSSPRDLGVMVAAAATYPLIRELSTSPERYVEIAGRTQHFMNTNNLVRNPDWDISVSKTGYISEAGRCLVMQTWLHNQPVVMVLMDSAGRYTRTADAQRVRKWLETTATGRLLLAKNGATSTHF